MTEKLNLLLEQGVSRRDFVGDTMKFGAVAAAIGALPLPFTVSPARAAPADAAIETVGNPPIFKGSSQ